MIGLRHFCLKIYILRRISATLNMTYFGRENRKIGDDRSVNVALGSKCVALRQYLNDRVLSQKIYVLGDLGVRQN